MRKISSFICVLLAHIAFGSYTMRDVNAALFIAKPLTNFEAIRMNDAQQLKNAVEFLFENELIDHIGSKAYDNAARFDVYFKSFQPQYQLIDLDRDGKLELIFNGFVDVDQEMESLEIYVEKSGVWTSVFRGKGNLLAYKTHVNTGEILLYLHQYPCCNHGSHNLDRLRLVAGKVQVMKRFFVGRETAMKGPFFPEKSVFTGRFHQTQAKTTLYWSPAKISKNAWEGRTAKNVIAHYPKQAVYTILAKKSGWKFVLMHAVPVDEPNQVINPKNFSETWIYGWLK